MGYCADGEGPVKIGTWSHLCIVLSRNHALSLCKLNRLEKQEPILFCLALVINVFTNDISERLVGNLCQGSYSNGNLFCPDNHPCQTCLILLWVTNRLNIAQSLLLFSLDKSAKGKIATHTLGSLFVIDWFRSSKALFWSII